MPSPEEIAQGLSLGSSTEITEKLGALTAKLTELTERVGDQSITKDEFEKAKEERSAIAEELQGLITERDEKVRKEAAEKAAAETRELLSRFRMPSKAAFFGGGAGYVEPTYQKGAFLTAILNAKSHDPETIAAGKAALAELGSAYQPSWGKATLGLTDATGGFIVPNNMVEALVKAPTSQFSARRLLNVVAGVTGAGVDQPYRGTAPARMTVIAPGSTKENLDLTYGNYTATMYTVARIYDLAQRFVRQSAGAAEQDVLQELTNAARLGENYYTLYGSGSSEPFGIDTALNGNPAWTTSFTPSSTTLVGAILTGVARLASALAARNITADAVLLNPVDFWAMATQGDDTGGYRFAGIAGPANIEVGTLLTPWGVPVYSVPDLTADTMLAGEFKSAKFYVGQDFRIDTSTEAGTRWDQNLVGFRGEEEIGFDAQSAVATGHFQRITNVAP